MRIFELLENRIDWLRDKHKDIKSDVFEELLTADPTRKKIYLQWLIELHTHNNLPLEDLYKATEYLLVFDKKKHLLPVEQRDINTYKSLPDLYDVIRQYEDKKSHRELKVDEKNEIYKEIKVVYDGPEGKILIPLTERASCFLGRGTKWCTAAEKTNYFKDYNSRGRLYIIICENGEKYQFHMQSNALMNETDRDVNIQSFKQSYPWVFNTMTYDKYEPTEQGFINDYPGTTIMYFCNPTEQQQLHAVQHIATNIKYIEDPTPKVQLYIAKHDWPAILHIKNPTLETQLLACKISSGTAIQMIKNPCDEVQVVAVSQSPYSISYIKSPCVEAMVAAVTKNGNVIEHIKMAPPEEVQIAAVTQNPDVIKLIKKPSEACKLAAVSKDGCVVDYISRPSLAVQLAAVNQYGPAIEYIKSPTDKVQLAAVTQSPKAFRYIKNPAPKVVRYMKNNHPGMMITESTDDERMAIVLHTDNEYRLPNITEIVPPEHLHHLVKLALDNNFKSITIYRGVPNDVNIIRPGDWVALDKQYALGHEKGGKVISMRVLLSHVAWAGTDKNEYYYVPPIE